MRYVLYVLGFLFVLWTVASSLTQVQSHERAVIRRFGRVLDHKPGQGLYIGLPWGIDRVDLAPVGWERTIEIGFNDKEQKEDDVIPTGQMLTGDHNLVNISMAITYRADEDAPEKFVLQMDNIDAFVARAAEGIVAKWIAGRTVDEILRHGKSELPQALLRALPVRLKDYELGVKVQNASVIKLEPPQEVKDAFDKLAKAKTGIDTRINEAEREANRKRSEAMGRIDLIQREADSYAVIEQRTAKADAETFRKRLAQYQELSRTNPEYLNTLWLDEMTRLYGRMRAEGRIELLDHFLTSEGLSITQFPLQARKK